VNAAALEAVDRIVHRGGARDEVLQAVVGTLVRRAGCSWACVLLTEDGRLVPGPHAGEEREAPRLRVPIVFGGDRVGELAAEGCDDDGLVDRVALLIAPYCRTSP
jgi:hypothetical protein